MWYPRFKILSSDTRWWGHLIEKKNMWEAVRATGWLILKSLRGLVSLSLCCQILLRGWFAQRRTVVHRLPSNTGGKENSIGALETTRDCFKRLLPIWAFFFLRERLWRAHVLGAIKMQELVGRERPRTKEQGVRRWQKWSSVFGGGNVTGWMLF